MTTETNKTLDEFDASLADFRSYFPSSPPVSVRQRLFDAREAAKAVLTPAEYRAAVG